MRRQDGAFRYKRGIQASYARQIYIYGTSLNYENLSEAQQRKIRKLCEKAAGDHAEALFDFVTTDMTAVAVCMKHHIASRTTLYNAVKIYYESFPLKI